MPRVRRLRRSSPPTPTSLRRITLPPGLRITPSRRSAERPQRPSGPRVTGHSGSTLVQSKDEPALRVHGAGETSGELSGPRRKPGGHRGRSHTVRDTVLGHPRQEVVLPGGLPAPVVRPPSGSLSPAPCTLPPRRVEGPHVLDRAPGLPQGPVMNSVRPVLLPAGRGLQNS